MRFYDPPDDISGTVFDPSNETFGPIMAALQSGDFEMAARLTSGLPVSRRLIDADALLARLQSEGERRYAPNMPEETGDEDNDEVERQEYIANLDGEDYGRYWALVSDAVDIVEELLRERVGS